MEALVSAVVGAIIGAFAMWLLGSSDRELAKQAFELQKKVSDLEEEKHRWEVIKRFDPNYSITSEHPQTLMVRSETPFLVTAMEYRTGDGSLMGIKNIDTESGESLTDEGWFPLDKKLLLKIFWANPQADDALYRRRPIPFLLRLNLKVDGGRTSYDMKLMLRVEKNQDNENSPYVMF
jgi:hypothetical protein